MELVKSLYHIINCVVAFISKYVRCIIFFSSVLEEVLDVNVRFFHCLKVVPENLVYHIGAINWSDPGQINERQDFLLRWVLYRLLAWWSVLQFATDSVIQFSVQINIDEMLGTKTNVLR
jgi:hypothetical protein